MRSHSRYTAAGSRTPNFLALVVAGAAVAVVYLNCDPDTSGADPGVRRATLSVPQLLEFPLPRQVLPVQATTTDADAPLAVPTDPSMLHGRWAMLVNVLLLKRGCAEFERVSTYTATLVKQERLAGNLLEPQTVSVKMRHQPFSVYMKWHAGDKGRQLIYVDGQNEGKMLVQPGGMKGRLTGLLKLDPEGSLAMSESRYPVTKAGLLELARTLLQYREADLARGNGFQCDMFGDEVFNERPCYLFVVTYDSQEVSQTYRKSILYVDKEWSMPVCVRNYTWAVDANPETIDDETLIELYSYTDIRLDQQLADADFDHTNSDYKLRIR